MKPIFRLLIPVCCAAIHLTRAEPPRKAGAWERVETKGQPHARHEAAFIECNGRFFLLGGRGIKPVDVYDPKTGAWSEGAKPPVEIHHFQPVVWEGRVLLAGAMTGGYPHETALPRIQIYDPKTDAWSEGAEIPKDRQRGGSGAVIHDGRLYLVCGIQNGHWDGWVNWLDTFDLKKRTWTKLPDAPRVRDHFQAVVIEGKIYAAGGRKTSGSTKQVFDLTIPEVDSYDLASGKWSTLESPRQNLPTPRAGNSAIALGHELLIAGGESMVQKPAHNELEALDTRTGQWRNLPGLVQGRHGTGLILWDDALYICAGSGGRGGSPELATMERRPWKQP